MSHLTLQKEYKAFVLLFFLTFELHAKIAIGYIDETFKMLLFLFLFLYCYNKAGNKASIPTEMHLQMKFISALSCFSEGALSFPLIQNLAEMQSFC